MKKNTVIRFIIMPITLSAILTGISGCIDNNNTSLTVESKKVDATISCVKNNPDYPDDDQSSQSGLDSFQRTRSNTVIPVSGPPPGMVWISGGEFSMGAPVAKDHETAGHEDAGHDPTADARPIHRVYVDGFYMDATEVTNAQFTAFVNATGYKTVAELKPTHQEFPDAPAANLVPGSVVFTPPTGPVPLDDHFQWWTYIPSADWRHPTGPGSSIAGKDNYPVVQIAWEDAAAYAHWAGKRLPTEAEWEFAARGGHAGDLYSWGNRLRLDGHWMANTFQGHFPDHDDAEDGYAGIAPVKQYPANSYGLYDMEGNVWEWCNDWYSRDYYRQIAGGVARNPHGPSATNDPADPDAKKKVQRGGSFLCTDQYCTRYVLGTRGKGEWRSAANHVGFRCIKEVFSPASAQPVTSKYDVIGKSIGPMGKIYTHAQFKLTRN